MDLLRVRELGLSELLLVEALGIPHRDAMPPPKLTADAPVLDIFEPVQVNFGPALGVKLDVPVAHRGLGLLDARIFQPPLPGEARLDRHIGTLGVAHVVLVGLLLHQCAGLLEQLGGLLPAGKTVQARERGAGQLVERAVGVEHIHDRQLVPQADVEIHLVVRGRDLERTGAEFLVHGAVRHDRNLRRRADGPAHFFPDERGVARIVRVHRDGHVARDRLGPGGLHLDELARLVHEFVAHLIEETLRGLHDHFLVGERGERHRAPVDHALAAVDVALPEQIDEHAQHGLRVGRIHRELRAIPIAGSAERLQLLQDDAALLLAPGPDLFEELLAAEVAAVLLLLAQLALHHRLRRDAGMIGARQPHGLLPLQPRPADKDVLDGVVEHMAHREDARDIRRRDDHGIGRLARLDPARKHPGGLPGGIPLLFDVLRFVTLGDLGHGRCGWLNRRENPAAHR